MTKRRIVVTGLGLVTPLGCGVDVVWRRLLEGQSGIVRIDRFPVDDLPAKVAGLVPSEGEGAFKIDEVVAPKEARKNDLFIIYGIAAAIDAVRDAGWQPVDEDDCRRTGVLIGSGIGGLSTIADTAVELERRGPRRVSPFFIPASLINLVSGQVSIRFGFKGPNHAVVTACSTGAHAIGDASRLIALGDADVMVAGGAEAAICRLGVAGFAAARALSTHFNDTPARASRPWDEDRDGFVMGEGAGVVVLEELEHARARGARIYGEIVGYGLSGDAYHITAPSPDGDGAPLDAGGADARRHDPGSDRLHQRPWHLDAARRRDRARRGQAPVRPRRQAALDVVDQVGDRPSARAAGSVEAIFSLLALFTRPCRRPSTWTAPRPAATSISCPTRRAAGRSGRRCPIPSASAGPMPA